MQAIVLARRDIREYDQIVSLYTYTEGKRELMARGLKKITSKNAPHLEPFSIVELSYVPGREIDHLTKVQPVEYFARLRQALPASLAAASAVRLTDRLMQEKEPDRQLFHALKSWLEFVSKLGLAYKIEDQTALSGQVLVTLLDAYLLVLLDRLGLAPILDRCTVCGLSFREVGRYAFQARVPGIYFAGGGLICPNCRPKKESIHEEIALAGLPELSAMSLLQKGDWRLVAAYPLADETASRVHELVFLYLVYHTEQAVADWAYIF